jgi:hypothetical protein
MSGEKDWKPMNLVPLVEKEDGMNNYPKFRLKATHDIAAAGYFQYVSGPQYNPPNIPALCCTHHIEGEDDNGQPTTIIVRGNEEVAVARERSKSWLDGDQKALAIITRAVPVDKLWVVEECQSAHAAWTALKDHYEPTNILSGLHLKQEIISFHCTTSTDPVAWCKAMVQLYTRLRAINLVMMPDREFASHLVALITNDPE